MVSLPEEFVATRIPGYFWSVRTKKLFSVKTGVLRQLKLHKPSRYNGYTKGYTVSQNGWRRVLQVQELDMLRPYDSKFPVAVFNARGDQSNVFIS